MRRQYLLTSAVDHIVHPALDEVEAVLESREVARSQPPIVDLGFGEFGLTPVALHHCVAYAPKFPDLSLLDVDVVLSDDADRCAGHREADRDSVVACVLRGEQGDCRA